MHKIQMFNYRIIISIPNALKFFVMLMYVPHSLVFFSPIYLTNTICSAFFGKFCKYAEYSYSKAVQ